MGVALVPQISPRSERAFFGSSPVGKMWPLYTGTSFGSRSFEEEKEQFYCFARQRRTQQANASKLCPDLRGDSKGFYRFSSEDRVID